MMRNSGHRQQALWPRLSLCVVVAMLLRSAPAANDIVFGPEQVVSSSLLAPTSVVAADLSGDGVDDVLAISLDDRIVWFRNIDGSGSFSSAQTITTLAATPTSVFAADIDGDSDLDVLSTSVTDQKIAWYRNMDGLGTFAHQAVIHTPSGSPFRVVCVDVDTDGALDVVYSDFAAVFWLQNLDGLGSFGEEQLVGMGNPSLQSIADADFDLDGDPDFAVADAIFGIASWFENTSGTGVFGPAQTIAPSGASVVAAADLDGDGDPDLLSGRTEIGWHRNSGSGSGSFGPRHVISNTSTGYLSTEDMDRDGDLDVLSASSDLFTSNGVSWFENLNGLGRFSSERVIVSDVSFYWAAIATDLDGDGDRDVLSSVHEYAPTDVHLVTWYEHVGAADRSNEVREFTFDRNLSGTRDD